jgi:hypothetical protein
MTSTTNVTPCPHCGMVDGGICHLIKAIEYYPDGTIKRVEFKGSADYAPAPIANPPQPAPGTWYLYPTWGANVTGSAPRVPNGTYRLLT